MNRIGPVLAAGVIVYIIIALWQAAVHLSVVWEAVAIVLLLGAFGSLLALKNPGAVKKGEMAVVWICIGLFAVYGIMKGSGML